MEWELVESDEKLQAVLLQASECPVVAIDTEFMRRDTFYPQVALVQMCFGDKAWLIDPLAIEDLAPLVRLLTNSAVVKVLHSASEDLEVFQHWLGVLPEPMFDTQRAAGLLDLGFGLGYRALVQEICEVDLPKGETCSNWLQRPLTASQCEYAAQDVTWLMSVWRSLDQRCTEQGKCEWVLADGRDAIASLATAAGDYYKRIKTAWKLDARQLGTLRAISAWREEAARCRDKPRGWIIDDQACLQLAQSDPHTLQELETQVELPRSALRRNGEELLQVLARARSATDDELPDPLPAPLGSRQREQVKKLRARVRAIAAELAMAPEVLLQGKDYELLMREASGDLPAVPRHWQGWRRAVVIDPLRQALAGAAG